MLCLLSFRRFSTCLLASLLILACGQPSGTQSLQIPAITPPKPLDPCLQALIAEYNQYFTDNMPLNATPGAAVVMVKDSSIIFIKGFGVNYAGSADSVNAQTVFRIGSLSKGFAAVLTGILVEDSLLTWHDRVKKWYPEFSLKDPAQADRIELWHLLSHTTGLPYHAFTNMIESGSNLEQIVSNYLPKAPIIGKEGTFYAYQNVAFCVVEQVMQAATHQTYEALLREKIFIPANMTNASSDYETLQNCPNKCRPNVWTGYQWAPSQLTNEYYNFAAAGGVNASIADMGNWLKVLLGYRPDIVKQTTLDQVFQPVIKTNKERRILPGWIKSDSASYAMGWRILQHQADTIVYHAGSVNGFKGEIAFDRSRKIGICVLFNGQSEMSGECITRFFDLYSKYCQAGH